jgi:ribosomal protein S6
LEDLKAAYLSAEAISRRVVQQGERFLAYPLAKLRQFLRRASE